jgi:hypothetical protein
MFVALFAPQLAVEEGVPMTADDRARLRDLADTEASLRRIALLVADGAASETMFDELEANHPGGARSEAAQYFFGDGKHFATSCISQSGGLLFEQSSS